MNVPCGGIHAGQRYTVQSSVIEIVLDRSDSMFISLRHRVYSLCSVRYRCVLFRNSDICRVMVSFRIRFRVRYGVRVRFRFRFRVRFRVWVRFRVRFGLCVGLGLNLRLGLGFGFYVTNSDRKVRIRPLGVGLGFYVTNSDRRDTVGDRVIFTNHMPGLVEGLRN